MLSQTRRDRLHLLEPVGVNTTPCIDKRSDQPWPHGALVIGEISGAQITKISWLILRVTRREGTQTVRGHKLFVYDVHNRLPALRVEYRIRQGNGEQLIWPYRPIITVFSVDDIKQ